MSYQLSGPIAAVKAVVDTLLSRLTSARAAKIDKVLQNNVWTNAKAAHLDAPISGISGGLTPPTVIEGVHDGIVGAVGTSGPVAGEYTQVTLSTFNTWVDLHNVTGKGRINLLNIYLDSGGNANNLNADYEFLIDGVSIFAENSFWTANSTSHPGKKLIGVRNGPYYQEIAFNTSFQLRARKSENSAGNVVLESQHRYWVE